MQAVFQSGEPGNRAISIAVTASLVVHLLLLFGSNLLSKPYKTSRSSPGPIIARLVESRSDASVAASPPTAPAPAVQAPSSSAKAVPTAAAKASTSTAAETPRAPAVSEKSRPPEPGAPPAQSTAPAPPGSVARVDPQPAASQAPASADEPNRREMIGRYGISLKSGMTKYMVRAQSIVEREKLTGRGELLLVIGADGRIAELKMIKSTGNESLDKAFLEAVRNAKTLVRVPEGLVGREFAVEIPADFRPRDS